jgi:(E)-4-hydroxy-3-methylbut-2-enyl-diphosphate synthase
MNKPEILSESDVAGPKARHNTVKVKVGNVALGGGAPIVVQSMTNTDTAYVASTVALFEARALAGS